MKNYNTICDLIKCGNHQLKSKIRDIPDNIVNDETLVRAFGLTYIMDTARPGAYMFVEKIQRALGKKEEAYEEE